MERELEARAEWHRSEAERHRSEAEALRLQAQAEWHQSEAERLREMAEEHALEQRKAALEHDQRDDLGFEPVADEEWGGCALVTIEDDGSGFERILVQAITDDEFDELWQEGLPMEEVSVA